MIYRRRDPRTAALYLYTLLREFRWTLYLLFLTVLAGALLYSITPHKDFGGQPPPLELCFLAAWLAMFAQPMFTPETWYLLILCGVYPLLGFGLIGEGIVRIGMLIVSRKLGEREWMMVKASTYRDHVVLCGVGNLGFRILTQLLQKGAHVVAIEKNPEARFLHEAKGTGTPVLIRDMKDDQALIDAGVAEAKVIVIASDDDLANIEVALDARRLNPSIRVVMRMFDQQIAGKFKDAKFIDEAFSSTGLAAPIVAEMAMRGLDPLRQA